MEILVFRESKGRDNHADLGVGAPMALQIRICLGVVCELTASLFDKKPVSLKKLELSGILEKIADEMDFSPLNLQYCNPFVIVGLPPSVGSTVRPVNSRPMSLDDYPLDFEREFRVLAKKNAEKPQYPFFAKQGLGFRKIERCIRREKVLQLPQIAAVHQVKKLDYCGLVCHWKTPFLIDLDFLGSRGRIGGTCRGYLLSPIDANPLKFIKIF